MKPAIERGDYVLLGDGGHVHWLVTKVNSKTAIGGVELQSGLTDRLWKATYEDLILFQKGVNA